MLGMNLGRPELPRTPLAAQAVRAPELLEADSRLFSEAAAQLLGSFSEPEPANHPAMLEAMMALVLVRRQAASEH